MWKTTLAVVGKEDGRTWKEEGSCGSWKSQRNALKEAPYSNVAWLATLSLVHWDHLSFSFYLSTRHKLELSGMRTISWENSPIRLAYRCWPIRYFLDYWLMWMGPPVWGDSVIPGQGVLSCIRKQNEQTMRSQSVSCAFSMVSASFLPPVPWLELLPILLQWECELK